LLAALGLAAVTLLAYLPALDNGFVFDDVDYVSHNPHVQAGLTGPSIAWAFTTGHASNWHPLTWLSLQTDHTLFGLGPWGYHLTNVVLHVANTLLLLLVLWKMTGALWPSVFVAGLFALHPLHVESVAWISERKDVLSTLFGLLALLAYAGYVQRPAVGRYLLVVLAFVLSLLAKPMLVTLPFLLLLLDYWPLKRLCWTSGSFEQPAREANAARPLPFTWLIVEKVPLFLLAGASCAVTWYAQQRGHSVQLLVQLPLSVRAGNAVVAYVVYLRKVAWPADLAAFYPHPGSALSGWHVAAAAVFLTAVTAVTLVLRKRASYLAVGWFWYLGTLVPVIGLVQVGSQALADRYTYVPLIGIFIMVAWSGANLVACRDLRDRALVTVAATVLLCILGLLTWLQVHYWHHAVTLWAHALEVTSDNAVAYTNLGHAIFEQEASPESTAIAFEHFARAVQIDPLQISGNLGLALLLQRRGQIEEAVQRFAFVVGREPGNALAQRGLGSALAMQKRFEKAAVHLREAVRIEPDVAENYFLLGEVYREQGNWSEALPCFRKAVDRDPRSVVNRCALAQALHQQGQKESAQEQYREATRINPDWLEGANKSARLLATDPEAMGRNGDLAVKLATQICQATDEKDPRYLDTLAAAFAEVGRYDDAVAAIRKALTRPQAETQPAFVRQLQERLRLYERRQPLRVPPARK
jgi:tetratricopeptide (TPR) repeat protein